MTVLFDAVGAGGANVVSGATSTNAKTWNHTVAADANCLVVGLTCWDITYATVPSTSHSRTVTYNSVAMTSLGTTDSTSYGFIEWFYLLSPATGTHTVSVSVARTAGGTAQPWAILTDSLSYKNVAGVTAGTGYTAASGSPACAVASAGGRRSAGMLSSSVNDPGSYNQTSRSSIVSAAHYGGVTSHTMIGDAAGAATVTHLEGAASNVVLAQAIDLTDSAPPAVVANQFFAMF